MNRVTPGSVEALLRTVAERVVMPRFRGMSAADIIEKSAGELVTVADRDAEVAIGQGLRALLPAARLVGEEACAADPDLLNELGDGLVWLVDPIDGTGNFAAGRPPFAMMVALVEHGETVQSWILDPLTGTVAHAERGRGAYLDGARISTNSKLPSDEQMVGILSEAFLPPDRRTLGGVLRARFGSVLPTQRCVGHEYPLVATGQRHFAIYWRTLAWDHAAGALFLAEAGGQVVHFDGVPYSPATPRPGLVLAANPGIAERLLRLVEGRADRDADLHPSPR